MKKRLLLTALALCLCVSVIPNAYALKDQSAGRVPAVAGAVWSDVDPCFTEERPETTVGIAAQMFAMARIGETYPTYEEAYSAMIGLKSKYPEGMTWTNYEPYGSKGSSENYRFKGGAIKGAQYGVGCAAFCFILSDELFGTLPVYVYDQGSFKFEDIRVGDFLRVNSSHFVTVLRITSSGVILAEGNYNGTVHWGRAISKNQLMLSANFLVTRYPAGYSGEDVEETIVASGQETGKDGTLDWTVSNKGVLAITGSGAMKDYDQNEGEQPSWEEVMNPIYSVDIGSGITSVGAYAFYQKTDLVSVSLPSTIASIGDSAFYGSNIIGVAIPGNVKNVGNDAFRSCKSLTSVDIANGVETIGERAFHSCTALGYVDFPRSLTKLGAGAFTSCEKLTQVRFMPSSKGLVIGGGAFTSCWNLNLVSLPEGITELPPDAFSSCKKIRYIYIPSTVTTLGQVGVNSPFLSSSVDTVYFGGTQAKWDAMTASLEKIPSLLATTYDVLSHATVVCEQSDPFVPDANDPGDIHFCENGTHVGPVEDGICQNCGEAAGQGQEHVHEWSDRWSSNDDCHWHECTAPGCTVTGHSQKDGYGSHEYDNDTDTTCNTCGYSRTIIDLNPSHTHNWAEEWNTDTAYHWHECTASGCTVTGNSQKDGYAAHVYDNSRDTICDICGYIRTVSSGGSSSSGSGSSSGGSSSSNTSTSTTRNPDGSTTTKMENKTTGTTTETTKKPDGSQTVVETRKDGTVTISETDAEGNKTETVTNPDGSSTTAVVRKDGTTASVTTSASGQTKAEVALPTATVSAAQRSGKAITLPIQGVRATQDTFSAPAVTVKTGSTEPVKVEITTENITPGTVAVIVHADGSEGVIKTTVPTENDIVVSLSDRTTVKIVDNSKSFTDISTAHWASNAINFISARELFSGTTAATFSPGASMTRAMLMTVLARYAGEDTNGGAVWYQKGMEWAVANAISDGSNPNDNISREQLITMLWRYSGSPAANSTLSDFTDVGEVSGYAQRAMRWAVEKGIISGYSSQLNPNGLATRAEAAAIIMRHCSGT